MGMGSLMVAGSNADVGVMGIEESLFDNISELGVEFTCTAVMRRHGNVAYEHG